MPVCAGRQETESDKVVRQRLVLTVHHVQCSADEPPVQQAPPYMS
jgi:hypothetical protein